MTANLRTQPASSALKSTTTVVSRGLPGTFFGFLLGSAALPKTGGGGGLVDGSGSWRALEIRLLQHLNPATCSCPNLLLY